MMKTDTDWMHRAIAQAQYAEKMGEVPVGAVIVGENTLIGTGFNQVINQSDPSAHAEIVALRNAGGTVQNYRLIDTTLYVTLEPCMMCLGALVHARVKRVVFGAYDEKTGACGSGLDLIEQPIHNHRLDVEGGVLQQECSAMLSLFFQKRRQEQNK